MKTKQELRKEILQIRDALTIEERQTKSHQITAQVAAQKDFIVAEKILLFASYKSEVDSTELFEIARRLSKNIYYPKVLGKEMEFYQVWSETDLIEGYRGIREPEANLQKKFQPKANDKIFILIPGAVFDETGNRIGYGGGFYDKYLQQLEIFLEKEASIVKAGSSEKERLSKIAVAFDCQVVETGKINRESHDIKPDYIVTEHKIIHIS